MTSLEGRPPLKEVRSCKREHRELEKKRERERERGGGEGRARNRKTCDVRSGSRR
jgi:hypothetical protein